MSQPTPGPWTIRGSGEVGTEDALIAVVYPTAIQDAARHGANASLIAHAPAMRQVLARIVRGPEGTDQEKADALAEARAILQAIGGD
jgi:hypothetical protein